MEDIGKQDVHQKDGQKEYAVVQEPVGGEGAPREPVQKQAQHIVGKGVVEADIEDGGQQIRKNDAPELFQVGPGKANDGKKCFHEEVSFLLCSRGLSGPILPSQKILWKPLPFHLVE